MKPLRLPSSLVSLLCLILEVRLLITAQADSLKRWPDLDKRYYHHDVVLDDKKHSDEFFTFVTRPDLDAPKWSITIYKEKALSDGYWFAGPYANAIQSRPDMPWNAPHIYDMNGDLIWSGAPVFSGYTTFDFRSIDVLGKPMLSVISQHLGQAWIFDDTYQIHKTLDLGDNTLQEDKIGLNIHEFTTVENGTSALYLTREPRRASKKLSKAVGFDGKCYAVWDGIRELDTRTWDTTWSWTSENRIGLDESVTARDCQSPRPWDFFHSNSIDKFPNGDFLISGRRTYTVYKVSRKTGEILWRLGGNKSDFKQSFKIGGQHAVKLVETNDTHTTISMLDNADGPGKPAITHPYSRGLIIQLDTTAMKARVLTEVPHPEGGHAYDRGNAHLLPNGNMWMAWTDNALQSEHAPDGTLLMKARFRAGVSSYRTFKLPWVGKPQYPPDVHAQVVEKAGLWYTVVHMSWNGATEVAEWKVFHANETGEQQKEMVRIPRRGFESSAWTNGYGTHVFVEALDKKGKMLGRSNLFESLAPRNRSQTGFKFDAGTDPGDSNDGNEHENEAKKAEQSFIQSMVNNSGAALALGVVIGMAISCGLVLSGLLSRLWMPRRKSSLAWWKQRSDSYSSVDMSDGEDQFELGDYESEDEDRNWESKSKSSGST